MKKTIRDKLIYLIIFSVMSSFLTKDILTPILLMGKEFGDRSLMVQILILVCFAAIYFLLFRFDLPRLLTRLISFKISQRSFFFIVMILTLAIMGSELFKPGMISGYDIDYHMLRIESLSETIRFGQFPTYVNPIFLNGYGYASSLFYPDLFLYFPASLHVLGLSTILSAKVFFFLIFTLCFLSAFWVTKQLTKAHYAGLMAAVVYCLSQYLLQNVYRRGAVGEMQAFIFLPLILYGLYSLIFERFDKYWLMAIGFIGLLYSHLISTLICAILVAVVSVFHARAILSDNARIQRILKLIVITLGCTIAFWLPLIEQISISRFAFSQSTYLARYSSVPISAIFAVTGKFSGSYVAFGLPTLLLCLFDFVTLKLKGQGQMQRLAAWELGIGMPTTSPAATCRFT